MNLANKQKQDISRIYRYSIDYEDLRDGGRGGEYADSLRRYYQKEASLTVDESVFRGWLKIYSWDKPFEFVGYVAGFGQTLLFGSTVLLTNKTIWILHIRVGNFTV
jgi:hypothetical protein